MSNISEKKKEKLKEEILSLLFSSSPNALYTSRVAEEIIRDEEFTLALLEDLYKKNLVKKIDKNNKGKIFLKRKTWTLNPTIYDTYKRLLK